MPPQISEGETPHDDWRGVASQIATGDSAHSPSHDPAESIERVTDPAPRPVGAEATQESPVLGALHAALASVPEIRDAAINIHNEQNVRPVQTFESRSEQNSPTSTAQTSRSPTPEYDDQLLEVYMERLGIRKPALSRLPDIQTPMRRHINDLPADIIGPIIGYISDPADILSVMLTQRSWLPLAAARTWFRPIPANKELFLKLATVLKSDDENTPSSLDYSKYVHRLNFVPIAQSLTDDLLASFVGCTRVDRLTLTRCTQVTAHQLTCFISQMPRLQSLDLHEVPSVNDAVLKTVGDVCTELQIYYGSGDTVSDEGLGHLARLSGTLRRLNLTRCEGVTAVGVVELITQCRHLVELDVTRLACFKLDQLSASLGGLAGATVGTGAGARALLSPGRETDAAGFSDFHVADIFRWCSTLRELHLDGSNHLINFQLGPRAPRMDMLRTLSLSMCSQLTDQSLEQLVVVAPRLRQLNISKCPQITDRGVCLIAEAYNYGLQHLHLGHCTRITDRAVARVAECCSRLAFFDGANCSNLTDIALIRLSRLTRLRRIGVVKCSEIGSLGVEALAEGLQGDNPIERLHLSYCSSISVHAIRRVLESCPRIVHLSLTGVRAFMRTDILKLSRPPPPELNQHQCQVFCVFSGSGVRQLRDMLRTIDTPDPRPPMFWLAAPFNGDHQAGAVQPEESVATLGPVGPAGATNANREDLMRSVHQAQRPGLWSLIPAHRQQHAEGQNWSDVDYQPGLPEEAPVLPGPPNPLSPTLALRAQPDSVHGRDAPVALPFALQSQAAVLATDARSDGLPASFALRSGTGGRPRVEGDAAIEFPATEELHEWFSAGLLSRIDFLRALVHRSGLEHVEVPARPGPTHSDDDHAAQPSQVATGHADTNTSPPDGPFDGLPP